MTDQLRRLAPWTYEGPSCSVTDWSGLARFLMWLGRGFPKPRPVNDTSCLVLILIFAFVLFFLGAGIIGLGVVGVRYLL